MLLAQVTHFFAVMLWVAVVLAALAGLPELSIAIAVIIVINGVFAFVQEYRADQAAARLRDLLPVRATVVRDGKPITISAVDLVVGDLVLLESGDRVCADLRLVTVDGLTVDESMLTGETKSVHPVADATAWAGTFVTEGYAQGEVVAIGSRTRLAGIALLSQAGSRRPSPLATQLHGVVRAIAVVAVLTGVGFFALSLLLGLPGRDGFLLAVGVTVALVPEGLLPTVTLSLARGAQRMADRQALVRSLESVETLGSTTVLCTDKTGTLTTNQMSVVAVWTPHGPLEIEPSGYRPSPPLPLADTYLAQDTALASVLASTGRLISEADGHRPHGDPMEVALHVLALRAGVPTADMAASVRCRFPFDPRRRRMSVVTADRVAVKGAIDSVLPLCRDDGSVLAAANAAAHSFADRGLRVLAVAERETRASDCSGSDADSVEADLRLLGVVALEDPPREGAAAALAELRRAGIQLLMVTGDHPATAAAIGREVGFARDDVPPIVASQLPTNTAAIGQMIDRDGLIIARATPEDKVRIAVALQERGHVVAMTGDGVNDGPALSRADIGIALGASGTDVARESADLVLLDDHVATIVAAVELGRATFANMRRFLTFHLTDNVAELAPFGLWALSGGSYPLVLSVLQVLALDIGTDVLPAVALGAEPANPRTLQGPMRTKRLIDGQLLRRVFGVLGPTEAVVELTAATSVLLAAGWVWGATPSSATLAAASGAAFAAVVAGQIANAYACRSEARWVGRVGWHGNPLLAWSVSVSAILAATLLAWPAAQRLFGGAWPPPVGWVIALATAPAVIVADALHKRWRAARRVSPIATSSS